MKPIYFPTTYVSASAAAALRALFPSIATCQPFAGRLPPDMRSLQESGFLDVLTPVAGGEQQLDDMVREFGQWGRLHAGGDGLHAAFWRQRLKADALAEEGSSSQLVSQIKSRLTPARGSTEPDRLMPARVFLYLAQEFDRQSCEVQRDLARHARLSAELRHALTGENDLAAGGRNQGLAFEPAGHEDHPHDHRQADHGQGVVADLEQAVAHVAQEHAARALRRLEHRSKLGLGCHDGNPLVSGCVTHRPACPWPEKTTRGGSDN